MSNLFLNLPVPSSGAGASVDVSQMGATKTIVVGGKGSITVEFSTDAAGTVWAPVPNGSFLIPGRVTIDLAAHWMRVSGSGSGMNVDVGAPQIPALFAQIGPAPVDISLLPSFKTVVAPGPMIVEVSEDGVSWSQAFSFPQAGGQSATMVAKLARCLLGTVWMGATPTGDDSSVALFASGVVWRQDDPAGNHGNVFANYADAYAAAREAVAQGGPGGGVVDFWYDETFADLLIPVAGMPVTGWDWTGIIHHDNPHASSIMSIGFATGAFVSMPRIGDGEFPSVMIIGHGMGFFSDRTAANPGAPPPFTNISFRIGGSDVRFLNSHGEDQDPTKLPMLVYSGGFPPPHQIQFSGECTNGGFGYAGQALLAPLVEIQADNNLNVQMGGCRVGNNAFMGDGELNLTVQDDSVINDGVDAFAFPALTAPLGLSITSQPRFNIDGGDGATGAIGTVILADSPYQATCNQLVRVATGVADAIVVTAPTGRADGQRFAVKNFSGGGTVTAVPQGTDVVEDGATPIVASGCKTWVFDGHGTWILVANVVPSAPIL